MSKQLFDVVVVGGGPAGVVTTVQAARAGARVLLVEKSGILGGTTVLNEVNLPGLFHAWGQQVIAGIGWEWVERSVREAVLALPDFSDWRNQRHWRLQVPVSMPIHAAVADRLVMDSGADLLLHCMPAKALYMEGKWTVTFCGKEGLFDIVTHVLVDTTGDANVVSLAGLPLHRNPQLQPATLVMETAGYNMEEIPPTALEGMEQAFMAAVEQGTMLRSDFQASRNPVGHFLWSQGRNSMHVPGVDASTSQGKTRAELLARAAMLRITRFFRGQPGMEHFEIRHCARECGIRESATIIGESRITGEDYTSGRVWPDAVCYSFYPIDIHNPAGNSGIDTRTLEEGIVPTLPLGALLPKNSRQLIVAGRCACGDQEAHSAYRVQASAMAMGQAAGAAATLAALQKKDLRDVALDEVKALLRSHKAIVPD